MNKAKITSDSLIDDASAYFINLKNTGNWKTEISRNTQIIALTMQISALETKVSKLSHVKAPTGHSATPGGGTGTAGDAKTGNYTFKLWHLKKVDSKAEHSMIEQDGKTWYWCDNQSLRACASFTSLARSMMHGAQRKIASKRVVPRSIR